MQVGNATDRSTEPTAAKAGSASTVGSTPSPVGRRSYASNEASTVVGDVTTVVESTTGAAWGPITPSTTTTSYSGASTSATMTGCSGTSPAAAKDVDGTASGAARHVGDAEPPHLDRIR